MTTMTNAPTGEPARTTEVELAGRAYRVGRLEAADWAPVRDWIKATVPGPLSILAQPDFARLAGEARREVLAEAARQARMEWPPRLGTAGFFAALDHTGGHEALLMACLGKYRPAIEAAEVRAILDDRRTDLAAILRVLGAALGSFAGDEAAVA